MREFFSGLFGAIFGISFIALIILSIANTVTSEFLSLAFIVFVIGWIINLFFRRHYRELVLDITCLIVFLLILLNIIYSRIIIAPGGETSEIMFFLYLLWGFEFIFLCCRSKNMYQYSENQYKSYLISRGAELQGEIEQDD